MAQIKKGKAKNVKSRDFEDVAKDLRNLTFILVIYCLDRYNIIDSIDGVKYPDYFFTLLCLHSGKEKRTHALCTRVSFVVKSPHCHSLYRPTSPQPYSG